LDDLMRLWSDGRVMKWVGFPHGLGYDSSDIEAWFANVEANPARHHFVIVAPEVGFCGETYCAVDSSHQRAGLDIKLIPEAQGKGLATDALRTLIRHVFAVEDSVNSVWTQPSRENRAARWLYRRCGLRPANRPPEITNGESFWALSREDALKPGFA
jgi:RimJ/RimL family protein N-acetyltransferase